MAHCRFSQGITLYQCRTCKGEVDITRLVSTLNTFRVSNCPIELYQAFKILRIGSNEFEGREQEHRIIKLAIAHLDPVANHTSSKHPTA